MWIQIHKRYAMGIARLFVFGIVTTLLLTSRPASAAASVTITSPTANQNFTSGSITLAGTAAANSSVVISENNIPLAWAIANGSGNWTANVSGITNGSHTFTAKNIENGPYAYFTGAGSSDTINRLRLSDNAINPGGGVWPFVTTGPWLVVSPPYTTSAGIAYFTQNGTAGKFDTTSPSGPVAVTAYEAAPNTTFGRFSPDGSKWYGANTDLDNVSVVDVASNTQTSTITVGNGPQYIEVDGQGKAYVSNGVDSTISVIDMNSNTVVDTIPVTCPTPGAGFPLPVPHDGYMFVSCSTDAVIQKIDLTSHTVLASFDVSGSLSNIGTLNLTPDAKVLYISGVFGASSQDKIVAVSAETGTVASVITLSGASIGQNMTPDGQYFFAGVQGAFDTTIIDIISTATNTVVDTIDTSSVGIPGMIAFGPATTASASVTATVSDSTAISILPEVGAPAATLGALFFALTVAITAAIYERKNQQYPINNK